MDDFSTQVCGVGALTEPARRALYFYVIGQQEPVSRDQAAAGAGLPRHSATFHLDRLVADGLLDIEFRRLSGRRGPGAGRPAKLYRRADRQIAVTLPPRHYDLVARILAAGVEQAARAGVPVEEAVRAAATDAGRRIAAAATPVRSLGDIAGVLAGHGYEPRVYGDTVVLANCPFHALAREHTALVCGLNLDLVAALLDGLGHEASARLDPAPGRCCVVVQSVPE